MSENKKKQDEVPFLQYLKRAFEIDLISTDSFLSHWKRVFFVVFVAFVYISGRYSVQTQLAQIERLNKALVDVRFEALNRSSDLIGVSRPSQVKALILKQGISLEESDQPAYTLNN